MDKSDNQILEEVVEERLLQITTHLANGKTGCVFSVLPTERGPRWRCHVCQVTVFGSKQIYNHEHSSDHSRNMVEKKVHPVENFREQSPPPPPQQTLLEISLAPGEPVPPGYEGEVRGVAEIQNKLDVHTQSPLIGLEYLFELHSFDDKEPNYICILCDKRGDPRTVMAHLNSYNHRVKFLENHFPKVNQKIHRFRSLPNYKRVCQILVPVLAEWIEKRFGRLAPHACDRESFERKRETYTQIVVRDVHFSDKYGETLEEFIKDEMFESKEDKGESTEVSKISQKSNLNVSVPGCKTIENVKRRSPSPPIVNAPDPKRHRNTRTSNRKGEKSPLSSVSSFSLSDDSSPERSSRTKRPSYKNSYTEKRSISPYGSRSRDSVRYSRYNRYSRSRSPRSPSPNYSGGSGNQKHHPGVRFPWRRPEYGLSSSTTPRETSDVSLRKRLSNETARWEEYRRGIIKIEDELDQVFKNHEKNPEKHPQYPEEWKKFWNRRYKELQAEHKDPSKHDFKPEWINFWNKRMREMHDMEVKARKDALRKRLNLPEEPQPIKFKIASKKPSNSLQKLSSSTDEVIVIDDSKDDELHLSPKRRSRSPIVKDRKRSHSPWEVDYPSYDRDRYVPIKRDYYLPPEMRYKTISKAYHEPPPEVDTDAQLNIVAVLRLLTALEEKLGSLGPKVVDMLTTALSMENKQPNSADKLLDDDSNCVFFETVKEKLKGQLLAKMIEPQAVRPAKNAVQRIASLLHLASERKRTTEQDRLKQGKVSSPLQVPGVGEIDKASIAEQITAALVAQGRTNITQEELEQLIVAVVGMTQAKSSGKELTTAEYVAKLKKSNDTIPSNTPLEVLQNSTNDTSAMDGLSDTDLKTLLQNFKDLSTEEQHGLISYLKKLEAHEPERVERLRKFVNLEPSKNDEKTITPPVDNLSPVRPSSVASKRHEIVDITNDDGPENGESEKQSGFVRIDSDEDDDYSYEDVFKAASKNLKEKQIAEEREKSQKSIMNNSQDALLKDAKLTIDNIMGNLGQKHSSNSYVQTPKPAITAGPIILSNELLSSTSNAEILYNRNDSVSFRESTIYNNDQTYNNISYSNLNYNNQNEPSSSSIMSMSYTASQQNFSTNYDTRAQQYNYPPNNRNQPQSSNMFDQYDQFNIPSSSSQSISSDHYNHPYSYQNNHGLSQPPLHQNYGDNNGPQSVNRFSGVVSGTNYNNYNNVPSSSHYNNRGIY